MRRLLRTLLGRGGLAATTAGPRRDSSVYVLALQDRRPVPGTVRRLSPSGNFFQPMISRCGTRVAYWGSENASDAPRVWVSRVDGVAAAACVSGGEGMQGHPFWHPDGRRLVHFTSKVRMWDPRRQFSADRPPAQLRWLDVDTGESSRLTDGPFVDERPTVSADGQTVVFVSNRSGRMNLWRVNADGTGLAQLTDGPGPDYRPCLSPDGRLLAYFSANGDGAHQVRVRVLETGEVLACNWTRRFTWSHGPFWYPDGRSLLVHALERGARAPALWWVDLASGGTHLLETPGLEGASHGTIDNSECLLAFDSRDGFAATTWQARG